MQTQHNIVTDHVNSLTANFPHIFERNFKQEVRRLGNTTGVYIDVYKELRIVLGNAYEVAAAIIELARRFGNGFHHSNDEVLHHMGNTISDAKLYRDKQKLKKLGVLHLGSTVKNRTVYFLKADWFQALVLGLFNKLGVQQRQNDGSHIISNESSVEHDHDQIEKPKSNKELIQKLDAIGTDIFTANKMIKKAGAARVEQELEYVLSLPQITKPGAYLYLIINNLDRNNPYRPQSGPEAIKVSEPYELVAKRLQRIENEARRRLSNRGIVDPMSVAPVNMATLFDESRKYSEQVTAEIAFINQMTKEKTND